MGLGCDLIVAIPQFRVVSVIMPAIEAILWRILNKGSCIQFGKDCGGAACWTIFSMSLAYLLHYSPVMESFVPKGLIFGFPCLIQVRIDGIIFGM